MIVSDLLSPDRILASAHATSKKRLLELISAALAGTTDTAASREIFESLIAREHLGSTGLGNGVAIPHGRISGNDGVQAVFVRLVRPLAYDAIDGKPVDLLFALAVPEHCTGDHLKLLSHIAELFSDEQLLDKLRNASDGGELLQLLSSTKH
jgi:PTS system nitrogen regulatory IIA component